MEPTDNELHAGCLGQHQRDMGVPRALRALRAALARPTTRSTAPRCGIAALRRARASRSPFDGLTFYEVASVTKIAGGIAMNVIPDAAPRTSTSATRRAARREEAEARLRELAGGLGELEITGNSGVGRRSPSTTRCAQADRGRRPRTSRPSRRGRRSRSSPPPGIPAVNFGPGATAQAHQRDESIEIAVEHLRRLGEHGLFGAERGDHFAVGVKRHAEAATGAHAAIASRSSGNPSALGYVDSGSSAATSALADERRRLLARLAEPEVDEVDPGAARRAVASVSRTKGYVRKPVRTGRASRRERLEHLVAAYERGDSIDSSRRWACAGSPGPKLTASIAGGRTRRPASTPAWARLSRRRRSAPATRGLLRRARRRTARAVDTSSPGGRTARAAALGPSGARPGAKR